MTVQRGTSSSTNLIWAMAGGLLTILVAIFALVWHLNEADRRWKDSVAHARWLAPGRVEIPLPTWLAFSYKTRDEIIRAGAPYAARNLSAVPSEIRTTARAPMAQAKYLVGVSNDLATACAHSDPSDVIDICRPAALTAHFQRLDSAFGSVPELANDFYLEFTQPFVSLKALTRFAATLCNYDAGAVSATLSADYADGERVADETNDLSLGVGECRQVFERKLRRPPLVKVNATGDAAIASQLRAVPEYRALWGDRIPAWSDQIAFSTTKTDVRRAFDNPGLCQGRAGRDCGAAKVTDPGEYAKALNESLRTEQAFSKYPEDALFRFKIGVALANSAGRDRLGATIVGLESGSVADTAGLRIGDRIVAMNGKPVFTRADATTIINKQGEESGYRDPLRVEVIRDGQVFSQNIAIAYNKAFFDAAGWNDWNVGWAAFFDGFSLGLAKYIDCWAIRPAINAVTNTTSTKTTDECVAQWRRDLPILSELYKNAFSFGSFIGTLISPVTWIAYKLVGPAIFGVSRFGAIVGRTTFALAGNSLREFERAAPGETPDATVRRIAETTPMAIVGEFVPDLIKLPSLNR